MNINDLLEVELPTNDSFLKIKETLTRIGIASNKNKTLYQSCHILFKRNKYYIVHFKELFMLDGKAESLSDEDRDRRNRIANLLKDWGLLTIVKPVQINPDIRIKVLSYKEKPDWNLIAKYTIGKRK